MNYHGSPQQCEQSVSKCKTWYFIDRECFVLKLTFEGKHFYRGQPVQHPSSSEYNCFGLKIAVTLLQSVTSSGYAVMDWGGEGG